MSNQAITQAVDSVLKEILAEDKAVIVFDNDNSDLKKEFGETRVIDSVFGERMIVSCALGLAMTGAKPVVKICGANLLKALDIIANEAALTEYMYNEQFGSSLVIRSDIGYSPEQGPQLCQSFESVFAQFPGISVVYPSNSADAKALMRQSVKMKTPVIFFENNHIAQDGSEDPQNEPAIGKASIVREGKDVTIISYGPMIRVCNDAAQSALECGVSCELIDLCSISPVDMDTIVDSVKKTGKVMIVHEARKSGGIGAEISARIAGSEALFYLEGRIIRVCAADSPIPYNAEKFYEAIPSHEDILEAIMQLGRGE